MSRNTKGTEKLNIAFIVPFLFRYQRGIERSCVQLANALTSINHNVTLFTWQQREQATSFYFEPALRIVRVPYRRYYQSRWAIPFYVFELLQLAYDIVNVYFAGYGEAEALTLARVFRRFRVNFIAGYPIEQTPHRFLEFRRYGFHRLLDQIIAKSPAMVPGISRFFEREVEVLPNGVNSQLFQRGTAGTFALRQQLGIDDEATVLLTVSALEKRKGIQHTIRALPLLQESLGDVHYVVVGDGQYRQTLEALTHSIGVSQRVHFTGAVLDVLPYYELAEVFILLSHGEGFPNVLLEAWAMGLPVIVSRHPPFPDIVPTELGICIDTKESGNLEAGLTSLLTSREAFSARKAQCRKYVAENYSWDSIAQKFLRLCNICPSD